MRDKLIQRPYKLFGFFTCLLFTVLASIFAFFELIQKIIYAIKLIVHMELIQWMRHHYVAVQLFFKTLNNVIFSLIICSVYVNSNEITTEFIADQIALFQRVIADYHETGFTICQLLCRHFGIV